MANKFREPNHIDVKIEDGEKKPNLIGVLRVKTNGILWRNANQKKAYHKVDLEEFIAWMKTKPTVTH